MDKVRVLVVGDSGVGKTSFLTQICEGETLKASEWTVGAQVFVKPQEAHGMDGGEQRLHFVEFWDVGGSRNYRSSRSVFYEKLNGIILMYDLTNVKSYHNLRNWIDELVRADRSKVGGIQDQKFEMINSSPVHGSPGLTARHGVSISTSPGSTPKTNKALGSLPMLIVGNKCDMATGRQQAKFPNSMKTFGVPSVSVSAFMDGEQQAEKLGPFLQQVIDHKFFPQDEEINRVHKQRVSYVTSPESSSLNSRRFSEGDVSQQQSKASPSSLLSTLWRAGSMFGGYSNKSGKVAAVSENDHIL